MEIDITTQYGTVSNIQFDTVLSGVPTGLTVTPVVGGGTFPAGNYFWEVTATTALGETTVSNEATTAVALNGSATLTWSAPHNVVTGYKIYRGTVSGAENILVATVASGVTTFTDTNVGVAGTPPASNTATVQDYTLITGYCWYEGFALAEATGTATASVDIQDSGNTIGRCNLAAGASETEGPRRTSVPVNGNITMHVTSGKFTGVVYVRIPDVC